MPIVTAWFLLGYPVTEVSLAMIHRTARTLLSLGITCSIIAACAPVPWDSELAGDLTPTDPQGDAGCTGPAKLAAMDPSSLPSCCAEGVTGEAHCMPKDKTPSGYKSAMAACAGGGSCIPDSLIKSGGAKPASCKTTILGKELEGACLSVCIPKIAAKRAFLNKGDCKGAADEVCAPCISPEDNKPTGACEIGQSKSTCTDSDAGAGGTSTTTDTGCPFSGPLLDVTGFPECDVKGARCVPEAQVAATVKDEQRKMLATCDKGGGAGYCVPDPLLARKGKYTAPTCVSVAGAEGRCLHTSIPFVASKAGFLPQDKCEASERCVPCFDPSSGGKETGACKIGCDTGPKEAAKTFKACCTNRGQCVPETSIPVSLKERVAQKECATNERCAPSEIVSGGSAYKPKTCKPSFAASLAGAETGVCLSDCLAFDGFFEGIAVTQEDCAAGEKCAPCSTFSGPTGAPGCPK